MTPPLNTTMDYIYLFLQYYQMEALDLINTPLMWMDYTKTFILDYRPCFNVPRNEIYFLHIVILLLKNFLVAHGMLRILPTWVSMTTFPSFILFDYYFRIVGQPVACALNMWNFLAVWSLLFQYDFTVISQYGVIIAGFTSGVVFLERAFSGFQFALDMTIILVLVWFVLRSVANGHFKITFIIFSCSTFYFNLHRGPEIPEIFYIFLFLLFLGLYGAYVASHGEDEEMMFFLAVATGIVILLCCNIAMYGFTGPRFGQEDPFNQLPTFDDERFNALKSADHIQDHLDEEPVSTKGEDDLRTEREIELEHIILALKSADHIQDHLDEEPVSAKSEDDPRTEKEIEREHIIRALILETQEAILNKPKVPARKRPAKEASKFEVESIVFAPNANGAPDLDTVVRVKHHSNETMLF